MRYEGPEVALAISRFMKASGRSRPDFYEWLGFRIIIASELDYYEPQPSMQIHNSVTDKIDRMNAALSPHWYALIKASIAREESK